MTVKGKSISSCITADLAWPLVWLCKMYDFDKTIQQPKTRPNRNKTGYDIFHTHLAQ